MDRRKVLQTLIGSSIAGFSGCSSSQSGQPTSTQGTSPSGSQTTGSSNPEYSLPLQVDWRYSEADGNFVGYEIMDGAFYLRDSGNNLHKLNISSGEREWYVSRLPSGNVILDSAGRIILTDNEHYTDISSYSPSGEQIFTNSVTEYGRWEELPIFAGYAYGADSVLYMSGHLQTDRTPSCYAIRIDPTTGEFLGDHQWHTGGQAVSLPEESDGIVVGGSEGFPSYIERINPDGESQWAVNLDMPRSSHIRRLHINGNTIIADYITSEKAGVIALDRSGNLQWEHEQRGAPAENFDILYSSMVTADYVITPFIQNRQRSASLTTLIFDKQSGDQVKRATISTPSGEPPSRIFGRAYIDDRIIFGMRTQDDASTAMFQARSIPDLSQSETTRLSVDPSGVMAKISEGNILCVNTNRVANVAYSAN